MRFAVRALGFALALVADASTILTLPLLGGRPLLFIALANCFAIRANALAGGTWGFAGGLALGLLFADARIGAMALAGLLAGSVPSTLRRLLFLHRWTGQAAMGAAAGALYDGTLVTVSALRGDVASPLGPMLLHLVLDAALTGAAVPLVLRGVGRVEREV
jgi:hypothetical protein